MTDGFEENNRLVFNDLFIRIQQVAQQIVLSSGKIFSLTQSLFYYRNLEHSAVSPIRVCCILETNLATVVIVIAIVLVSILLCRLRWPQTPHIV